MKSGSIAVMAAVAVLLGMVQPAVAAWPDDKPIEVVVGFAPGGGTDLLARKLLPFVQKRLGPQAQFVVVNKPGAAGEIANAHVKNAKPDGYTVAVINVPGFLYVPMIKKSQYEARDFTLVSRVVDDPTVLVTRTDNAVQTLPAVVDALRRKAGSLSFGHNGVGTNGDLALQLLARTAKVSPTPSRTRARRRRRPTCWVATSTSASSARARCPSSTAAAPARCGPWRSSAPRARRRCRAYPPRPSRAPPSP